MGDAVGLFVGDRVGLLVGEVVGLFASKGPGIVRAVGWNVPCVVGETGARVGIALLGESVMLVGLGVRLVPPVPSWSMNTTKHTITTIIRQIMQALILQILFSECDRKDRESSERVP